MSWFRALWRRGEKNKAVKERIKRALSPETDLRNKLNATINALQVQCKKLELAILRLKEKDKYYYVRILGSLRARDRKRAIIYANELSEVRKALRSVNYVRLALEQVVIRLSTVKDMGDAASKLAPAIKIITSIRGAISEILPQAEEELTEIADQLDKLLIDTTQMERTTVNLSLSDLEAEEILMKAERDVEKEMREKLPPIPSIRGELEIE